MSCPACGHEVPAGARFCPACGAEVGPGPPPRCARCGGLHASSARYCPQCGSPLAGPLSGSARTTEAVRLPEFFRRLMPREYVEHLLAARGHATGERRVITILFSDVKGSTSFSEALDPEEVLAVMNGAFGVLLEPVFRYEGTLARLMGDAILCFFGAPIAHEDDPERACRCALDLVAAAHAYGARLERERGLGGFSVRVGVHTGLVVLGEVGSDLRVEYTAMGDAVNLAARLEAMAEPGTVLVSAATERLLHGRFETTPLGSREIRGRRQPVEVFRLAGLGAPGERSRGPAASATAFVGRAAELATLRSRLGALAGGRGGIVALRGEPGAGKSRLVSEARAATPAGVRWAVARGSRWGGSVSQDCARDLLRSLEEGDAGRQGGDTGAAEAGAAPASGPGPFAARIQDLARKTPLVVVWEDLQWLDASSLGALEALLPLCAGEPLLLLLLSRPDEALGTRLPWDRLARAGAVLVDLPPLGADEAARLLSGLPGGGQLPPALAARALEAAGGNPLFLEEVVRALTDTAGAPADAAGPVRTHATAALAVPETLQGALTMRIDRLRPIDRRVLQAAAVLGRACRRAWLGRMLEGEADAAALDRALEELCARGFLEPAGDDAFTFRQSLAAEAAYQGLLVAERRALHQRAAEAIEALAPAGDAGLAALGARHWERAGSMARALAGYEEALRGAPEPEREALARRAARAREALGQEGHGTAGSGSAGHGGT